jgi:hypothetical protein
VGGEVVADNVVQQQARRRPGLADRDRYLSRERPVPQIGKEYLSRPPAAGPCDHQAGPGLHFAPPWHWTDADATLGQYADVALCIGCGTPERSCDLGSGKALRNLVAQVLRGSEHTPQACHTEKPLMSSLQHAPG